MFPNHDFECLPSLLPGDPELTVLSLRSEESSYRAKSPQPTQPQHDSCGTGL